MTSVFALPHLFRCLSSNSYISVSLAARHLASLADVWLAEAAMWISFMVLPPHFPLLPLLVRSFLSVQ